MLDVPGNAAGAPRPALATQTRRPTCTQCSSPRVGGSNYCPAHRVHIMAELHRQAMLCNAGCEVAGGRLVGACEAHETIARQLQHEGTVALC